MSDADFDKFWEIATQSGIDDTVDGAFPDMFLEVTPEDLASVLQSINEMGSWLAHYLMNSINTNKAQIPPRLYSLLAVVQGLSREILTQLVPCSCPTCRPKSDPV